MHSAINLAAGYAAFAVASNSTNHYHQGKTEARQALPIPCHPARWPRIVSAMYVQLADHSEIYINYSPGLTSGGERRQSGTAIARTVASLELLLKIGYSYIWIRQIARQITLDEP